VPNLDLHSSCSATIAGPCRQPDSESRSTEAAPNFCCKAISVRATDWDITTIHATSVLQKILKNEQNRKAAQDFERLKTLSLLLLLSYSFLLVFFQNSTAELLPHLVESSS
jgi:hypothetical protein